MSIAAARKHLHDQNSQFQPGIFVPVTQDQWPIQNRPPGLIAVFRSRELLVQVFEEKDHVFRLSVNRTQINEKGIWKDGITWEQLQAVKKSVGFGEHDAVEIYPKECDVVNKTNMRHLWIVQPNAIPFCWRGGNGSGFKLGNVAETLLIK